jgi:hypothetical protein
VDPFIGSRFAVFKGGCIVSRYRFGEPFEPVKQM